MAWPSTVARVEVDGVLAPPAPLVAHLATRRRVALRFEAVADRS